MYKIILRFKVGVISLWDAQYTPDPDTSPHTHMINDNEGNLGCYEHDYQCDDL